MTNNDILRRIRYTFDLNDNRMMGIFGEAGYIATRAQISAWLKKEEEEGYEPLEDKLLATFLNGFINFKRGKKEGEQPEAEQELNHNIVFRKLKIALNLKAEEVLEILLLANFRLSKHELSAFFRRPDHKHYRECKDQVLRNFMAGMQKKYRTAED